MQAIIMAAGKGSRIETLTDGHPKSFLKINDEKLIERNVRMLREIGIDQISIVTGYHDWEFETLFEKEKDVRLIYNPFYEFTNVIGSFYMGMHALTDDFVYLHADTICEKTIFEDMLGMSGDIILPVDTKPCDEEAMKVKLVDGKLVDITKEMHVEEAYGEFIGVAFVRKNVMSDLQSSTVDLMRNKAFSSYFEGALQELIKKDEYAFQILDVTGRFWAEIDFEEDYRRAIRMAEQGI